MATEPHTETLMEKAEQLGKDAARYRWLREHWDQMTGNTWREPIGPKLDAAIDAARAASSANEGTK